MIIDFSMEKTLNRDEQTQDGDIRHQTYGKAQMCR